MGRRGILVTGLIAIAGLVLAMQPVCVPLSPEQLAAFNAPIEARTDHDFYLRVFQQIDGEWYQCKTWLSRQLFF